MLAMDLKSGGIFSEEYVLKAISEIQKYNLAYAGVKNFKGSVVIIDLTYREPLEKAYIKSLIAKYNEILKDTKLLAYEAEEVDYIKNFGKVKKPFVDPFLKYAIGKDPSKWNDCIGEFFKTQKNKFFGRGQNCSLI